MSCGDLSIESPSRLSVTWSIPDFFRLTRKSGYSVWSPDCGRHCLRMYQIRNFLFDYIGIELVNSTEPDGSGAELKSVEVLKSTTEPLLFARDVDNINLFRLHRSDLEAERDEYVPDGTLTVLCKVLSFEPGSAVSSMSGGARPRLIPSKTRTGNLSSESSPFLYVRWRIPAFFRRGKKSRRTLVSPEFRLSDHRYRLRLMPNQNGNNIRFHLVNSTDPVPGRYVWYLVGLMSTSGEEIEIKSSGPSTKRNFWIPRSDLDDKQPECFPDDQLTVFCTMLSREPTSAENPKSGGAETPRWKALVPQAAAGQKSSGAETCDEEEDQEALPGERYERRLDLLSESLSLSDVNSWLEAFESSDSSSRHNEKAAEPYLFKLSDVSSSSEDSSDSSSSDNEEAADPSFRPCSIMTVGKLSFESSTSLSVTWCIPDFFRLTGKSGYSLWSPDYGRLCLRMYEISDLHCDYIRIELVNSTEPDPRRADLYEVVLKSATGELHFDRDVKNRKVFRLRRRDLEDERDEYVHDGTLTVLCSVLSREPGIAESSKSGGARTRVIPTKRTGNLSPESFRCLYVTWRIPAYFRLARESRRTLLCPEFPFSDHRYRLRLFPSQSGNNVHFHLVNSTDPVPGRYVSYKVGLKSISGEEIDIEAYGPSTKRNFYIPRSDLDDVKPECFPDGHLTVFCFIRSREPSSAGSPKSGGAETWDEEKDQEALPDDRHILRHLLSPWPDKHDSSITDFIGSSSSHNEKAAEPKILNYWKPSYVPRSSLWHKHGSSITDFIGSVSSHNEKAAEPSCRPPFTVKSGDLSFDSPRSLGVTWNITDFFRHTTESAYSIQCRRFTFADGRYCLRLSSSENNKEFVDIQLVNLTDTVFGRYVWYEVGLKSTTGKEIDVGQFRNSSTRKFRIRRDELDKKKSECFPDGHLTVFCCMRSREPNNAGNPNSGGAQSHLFPGSKAAAHPKSIAVQTSNAEEDKEAIRGVDQLQFKYKYLVLAA